MSFALAAGIWALSFIVVALALWRARGSSLGFPLTYLVALGLIHVPGALVYSDGQYWWFDPDWVRRGFELSAIGALAFAFGVLVLGLVIRRTTDHEGAPRPALAAAARPGVVLMVGLFAWLVLMPLAADLPSLGSLVSAASQLVPIAFILAAWRVQALGDPVRYLPWLFATLCLPLITVGGQGFLGFGTTMAIVIAIAVITLRRAWLPTLPVIPILVFVGLSVFVTYMRDRGEIRNLVWGGAPVSQRADQLVETMTNFEWFDPENQFHRMQIDRRLNQNWMVGAAAERFDQDQQDYAGGETLLWGFIALIPRAIWPDKPIVGGGGDLVSRFTGATFAQGTSVGAGQVLEFQVNFGTAGIVVCFLLLGLSIAWLDRRAGAALVRGDWHRFLVFAAPAVAALQPGGNFAEITTSVVAAYVVAWLVVAGFAAFEERARRRASTSNEMAIDAGV
jgi:hypothetical protein